MNIDRYTTPGQYPVREIAILSHGAPSTIIVITSAIEIHAYALMERMECSIFESELQTMYPDQSWEFDIRGNLWHGTTVK